MLQPYLAPLACFLAFVLSCQANEPASPASKAGAAPGANTVVARVDGEDVTLGELDAWIKDSLFERQTAGGNPAKLYELRDESLREMITKRLVAAEADRRNMSEEEFVDAEIAAMGEVSDEEVAAFYQEKIGQMGGQTLEDVAPRIRDYLARVRQQTIAEKLIEAADIDILLERPRVEVAADGPSKGPENAPVTIIEFSDFQCPFCSRALPVIEEVMARYPNEVRLVYRHLPLDRIHSRARAAAEASLCAQDQGQFWSYHDLLFANARDLGDEDLERYAQELGLDVAAWQQCVSEGRYRAKVDTDVEAAQAIGISGTPAFIINGVILTGARPVEEFVSVIDSELGRKDES